LPITARASSKPPTPRATSPPPRRPTSATSCADSFPALADAPIIGRRLCVYGDTRDAQFWIARHPQRPDLTVATGGSGHAFRFAPVLGELIADAVLGRANRFAHKFRWRTDLATSWSGDAARSS
jgi:glycine/D-amino acid oxidase-like deaminating enzyme